MDAPTSPILPSGPASPTDPKRERTTRLRRAKRVVLISSVTLLTAGIGGGAYAVASFLSGGGTQPEQVLPAGAVAFAKIDLDPAVNQKLAVYNLVRKFPGLARQNGDEDRALRDSVVAGGLGNKRVSYDRDIKPWLGDRAAIAVYPPMPDGADPRPAIAVAYTDEAKMTVAMKKIARVHNEFGWTTRDGYVVISDTSRHARDLAAKSRESPLAAQDTFRRDIDALAGDHIGVAWADLGGIYRVATSSGAGLGGLDLVTPAPNDVTGRFTFGLRAANNYVEVQGKSFGVAAGRTASGLGNTSGTNLAAAMPADSLAVVSVSGLGQVLADTWTEMTKDGNDPFGIRSTAEQAGLSLPRDFQALFGTETALAVGAAGKDEPDVAIHSRGGDRRRVGEVANMVAQSLLGGAVSVESTREGVVAGNDATTVKATAKGGDPLRGSATYRLAVPDAERAGVVAYANVGQMIDRWRTSDADAQKLKALSAVGFTVTGSKDPTLRLRITVR